jgi:hypothetical protein
MELRGVSAKPPRLRDRLRGLLFIFALVAVMVLIASVLVTVAMMLLPLATMTEHLPLVPVPVPPPEIGGVISAGTLVGGAFLLFLLLIPFYLIGFGLLCCCLSKGGAPSLPVPQLPELPDMKRLAVILRGIAAELERLADVIEGVATAAEGLRDQISSDFIDIGRPTVRTHSATFGPVTVEVFDGIDWAPMFNDDQKSALRSWRDKFADDSSGNNVLSTTAASLRAQATMLKQRASALDGQPA